MQISKKIFSLTLLTLVVTSCSYFPTSGPSSKEIDQYNQKNGEKKLENRIEIIDVTQEVVAELSKKDIKSKFSDVLTSDKPYRLVVGKGDLIEISIWEAPPATLFNAAAMSSSGISNSAGRIALPEQMINSDGNIAVPFAGTILASGRTLNEIEKDITARLKGKANQAQVIARVVKNSSSNVTIIGEVLATVRMPLTANNEKLLDGIAAAGGVKQPPSKVTIQVTRGEQVVAMPLETILNDSSQNFALQAGDLVTALFQPKSFTALGATNKNEEVSFETQGISLAQALARTGGLNDSRADAKGLFIFRFEDKNALNWAVAPKQITSEGKVPVVYRIDLKDPASFFNVQNFKIENRDILYVSNAPITETQKFLNVLFSISYPILNATAVLGN